MLLLQQAERCRHAPAGAIGDRRELGTRRIELHMNRKAEPEPAELSLDLAADGRAQGVAHEGLVGEVGEIVVRLAITEGADQDEGALVEALTRGRLAGAALDTFEQEPLDAEAGRRFAGVPNLLLTPHIAGVTEESNKRVSAITAENVARVLEKLS